MSSGPCLFSDIGREARELLTRDYVFDHNISVSAASGTGVVLTSTAAKKGGLSTEALYKYNNALFNIKFDKESNVIVTTLTLTDLVPSTKTIASFNFPDCDSAKLEVQLLHPDTTITAAVALNQITSAVARNQIIPAVDFSTTIYTPTCAVGSEICFDSGNLTKGAFGMSFTKSTACASIICDDDGDTIKASYVHHFGSLKRSAAVGEISRRVSTNENAFTVGGLYAIGNLTTVKAKLNSRGKLGVVLQHEVVPKFRLSLASEIDTALDKTPRFGLALALKP